LVGVSVQDIEVTYSMGLRITRNTVFIDNLVQQCNRYVLCSL